MFDIQKIFSNAGALPSWDQERNGFFKAVKENDGATVQAIGAKYPDCVLWNNGKTPVEIAIRHGADKSLDALIALKANVDVDLGEKKGSLLHVAIACKRIDIAEKLIAAGASVDAKSVRWGGDGYKQKFTALAVAIDRNDRAAVTFLLDKGASTNGGACLVLPGGYDSDGEKFGPVEYARAMNRNRMADFIRHRNETLTAPAAETPAAATPSTPKKARAGKSGQQI
jgi:ankyrin repeat protein